MTTKLHRYFRIVLLMFLTIMLAGCASALVSTETPIPTALSPTSLPTPTLIPATDIPAPLPTPLPTQPPFMPVITPDAIQVERWREYQTALAKGILPTYSFENIVCEWDILARSGQEVYVWAVCASPNVDDTRPAVIHLGADGSVQSVEIPKRGSLSDFNRLFPEVAQAKMNWYVDEMDDSGKEMIRELYNHIEYRRTHPEESPLIVLSATPIP